MNIHPSDNSWLDTMAYGFDPVSLETLNSKAAMLSRIDNKYILDRAGLERVLPNLMEQFDILEINEKRAFDYRTRYFDDAQRSAYYEHHQGLRKGFKVRARHYADANLCFLEVKVKGRRGMTEKHRLPYELANQDTLTEQAHAFISETYFDHYGKSFKYALAPTLKIHYQRITFVAKQGGERITLDGNMSFQINGHGVQAPGTVLVAEVKSSNGRGAADLVFRSIKSRPTKKCSKYCIGMATMGEVSRWNRFLPTMRLLQLAAGNALIHKPKQLEFVT